PGRPCDVVRRASIKLTSSPLRQNRAERASTNRAARAVELDEPVGVSSHQRGTESSNPSSSSGESVANLTFRPDINVYFVKLPKSRPQPFASSTTSLTASPRDAHHACRTEKPPRPNRETILGSSRRCDASTPTCAIVGDVGWRPGRPGSVEAQPRPWHPPNERPPPAGQDSGDPAVVGPLGEADPP